MLRAKLTVFFGFSIGITCGELHKRAPYHNELKATKGLTKLLTFVIAISETFARYHQTIFYHQIIKWPYRNCIKATFTQKALARLNTFFKEIWFNAIRLSPKKSMKMNFISSRVENSKLKTVQYINGYIDSKLRDPTLKNRALCWRLLTKFETLYHLAIRFK